MKTFIKYWYVWGALLLIIGFLIMKNFKIFKQGETAQLKQKPCGRDSAGCYVEIGGQKTYVNCKYCKSFL